MFGFLKREKIIALGGFVFRNVLSFLIHVKQIFIFVLKNIDSLVQNK